MLESGVPTICSRARSLWTRSRPLNPVTMSDAERDQHDARDDASVPKELARGQCPFLRSVDAASLQCANRRAIRAEDGFG
jgi:hypothetical protein